MSDKAAWLVLALGVAVLLLGLTPYSPNALATRLAPVLAMVLAGVVIVFAIVAIAD